MYFLQAQLHIRTRSLSYCSLSKRHCHRIIRLAAIVSQTTEWNDETIFGGKDLFLSILFVSVSICHGTKKWRQASKRSSGFPFLNLTCHFHVRACVYHLNRMALFSFLSSGITALKVKSAFSSSSPLSYKPQRKKKEGTEPGELFGMFLNQVDWSRSDVVLLVAADISLDGMRIEDLDTWTDYQCRERRRNFISGR